ncbi:hypothetical protein [Ottowia sp.]|uniref:hypothetical protein n=1 Tax=Ottowia sp. TaxID=1898956 RepID=UPI0039E5D6D8
MGDVAAVTQGIQDRTRNDGFLGLNRNDNLHQTVNDLKGLSPAERNQAVAGLSDDDLKALASDANSGGLLGASGLSADEKRDMFNALAQGLDGQQLGRVATAFGGRDDVAALGKAVAQNADSATKVDFIEQLAPHAANGDHGTSVYVGGSTIQDGDKEAGAIGEVLASLGNDPAAFDQGLAALDKKALDAVALAGIGQTTTTSVGYGGAGSVSVSHDTQQLSALVGAAANSTDPAVKARVLDASSGAIQTIRDNTRFPVVSLGTDAAVQQITSQQTKLMNTDVRGIVDELNKADQYGKGLSTYLSEVLKADPVGGSKVIGEQLAQLQGAGTGMTPTQFFEQQVPGTTGAPYYRNAQSLGYFTGAMRNGLTSQNDDATRNGTIVKSIVLTAVSAAQIGPYGGAVLATAGQIVDRSVESANGDRTALGQALQDLAVPHDANGQRYQGPATPTFDAKAANVRHN